MRNDFEVTSTPHTGTTYIPPTSDPVGEHKWLTDARTAIGARSADRPIPLLIPTTRTGTSTTSTTGLSLTPIYC